MDYCVSTLGRCDDHCRAIAWAEGRLATGTRSTTNRRGIHETGKNLQQTRTWELHHKPRAVELRRASSQQLLRRARQTRQLGPVARYRRRRGGSGKKAHGVAISIEDRRTERWQQQAAILGADRLRYLSGKRLGQYSREELGEFQIITDVYGGFTYTENLSRFVEKVLNLLETGGVFYTVLPAVHLEDGREKLGTWFRTELVDSASRPVTVCSWLKQSTCTKVTCESKSDWKEPSELIEVRKVCSGASVLRMKTVEYQAGAPPDRRFQLER